MSPIAVHNCPYCGGPVPDDRQFGRAMRRRRWTLKLRRKIVEVLDGR